MTNDEYGFPYVKGLVIHIDWLGVNSNIRSATSDEMNYHNIFFRPYLFLSKNKKNAIYFQSAYKCPYCGSPLYKTRVRYFLTEYHGKNIELFNIFTCPTCRRFYASLGHNGEMINKLDERALESKQYNINEYMDAVGEVLYDFLYNYQ